MRPLFAFLTLSSSTLLFTACGNNVVGSTGSTGSGGDSTTGSGGAAGACPAAEPQNGDACALAANQTCSYGECCPSVYECSNGVWQAIPVDCPSPGSCPVGMPSSGSTCDSCFESQCAYVCPDGQLSVTATCQPDNVWQVPECPAPPPGPCGNEICKPGDVCVQKTGGAGFSYFCAANPCVNELLSCTCAQQLCGGAPFVCTAAVGSVVYCDCSMCP